MTEPTTTTIGVVVATASGYSQALLGVDVFAVLGAGMGVVLAILKRSKPQPRVRLLTESAVLTVVGGWVGTVALYFVERALGGAVPVLVHAAAVGLLCAAGGFKAKEIVAGLGGRAVSVVAKEDLK